MVIICVCCTSEVTVIVCGAAVTVIVSAGRVMVCGGNVTVCGGGHSLLNILEPTAAAALSMDKAAGGGEVGSVTRPPLPSGLYGDV